MSEEILMDKSSVLLEILYHNLHKLKVEDTTLRWGYSGTFGYIVEGTIKLPYAKKWLFFTKYKTIYFEQHYADSALTQLKLAVYANLSHTYIAIFDPQLSEETFPKDEQDKVKVVADKLLMLAREKGDIKR